MGMVHIRKRRSDSPDDPAFEQSESPDWIKFAAGGALIAGGLLLLSNKRHAGLIISAAGAGLAVADQQDTVRAMWNQVPGYIDRFQGFINQVQSKVDTVSAKRDSLHR
ncbi:MAG: hypothetical protein WBF42_07425, partial [Terracidiphilus sp.]